MYFEPKNLQEGFPGTMEPGTVFRGPAGEYSGDVFVAVKSAGSGQIRALGLTGAVKNTIVRVEDWPIVLKLRATLLLDVGNQVSIAEVPTGQIVFLKDDPHIFATMNSDGMRAVSLTTFQFVAVERHARPEHAYARAELAIIGEDGDLEQLA